MSLALVELGLGYNDFLELTPFDLAYLYGRYKIKNMIDFTMVRNSFFNAYVNARRGKKDKFIPLFDEIEGKKGNNKIKEKSPEELRKEREEFFKMVKVLGGGC